MLQCAVAPQEARPPWEAAADASSVGCRASWFQQLAILLTALFTTLSSQGFFSSFLERSTGPQKLFPLTTQDTIRTGDALGVDLTAEIIRQLPNVEPQPLPQTTFYTGREEKCKFRELGSSGEEIERALESTEPILQLLR